MKKGKHKTRHGALTVRGVTVLIPSYNGAGLLARYLPSVIAAAEGARTEVDITVVDDASSDDTQALLRDRFPSVRLVRLPENSGFGAACNYGAGLCASEFVFLLNNDMEVPAHCIDSLLECMSDPGVFAVAPRIVHPALDDLDLGLTSARLQRGWLSQLYGILPSSHSSPVPILYASGGAALVRRRIFLELGGFDPLYEPYYFEDLDLSYTALKRGYRVLLQPTVSVFHQGRATIGSVNSASSIARTMARNKLLFMWKNLTDPSSLLWHLVLLFPRLLFNATRPGTPPYLRALPSALLRLPAVLGARLRGKEKIRLTDRRVIGLISRAHRDAGVLWLDRS